jgi:hypothetical protein
MKIHKILVLLLLAFIGIQKSFALDVSLFITKNGSSTDFSSATPRWWNFTVSDAGAAAGLVVVNGNFTIIKEPQATADITFSLYSGFINNGTATGNNSLLASTFRPATDFSGGGGTTQLFTFTSPPSSLTAGAYAITLTTAASTGPNQAFKTWPSTEAIVMQNTSGTPLSSTYYASAGPNPTPYVTPTPGPTPGPTPVPEPGQVAASLLLGLSIGIYWFLMRKKQRQAA